MKNFTKHLYSKFHFLINQDIYAIKYDELVKEKNLTEIEKLLKIAKNTHFIKKNSYTVIPHTLYLLQHEKNHHFTKQLISLLIEYKADINERELNNENTIHYAFQSRDLSLIKHVLDLKADLYTQHNNSSNNSVILPSAFIKFFTTKNDNDKSTIAVYDFLKENREKYNISFTKPCYTQRPMGFFTQRDSETPLNISINFQNYNAIEYLLTHRKDLEMDLSKCCLSFQNVDTSHPKYSTEEMLSYFKDVKNERIQLILEKIALFEENKEHLSKNTKPLKI